MLLERGSYSVSGGKEPRGPQSLQNSLLPPGSFGPGSSVLSLVPSDDLICPSHLALKPGICNEDVLIQPYMEFLLVGLNGKRKCLP